MVRSGLEPSTRTIIYQLQLLIGNDEVHELESPTDASPLPASKGSPGWGPRTPARNTRWGDGINIKIEPILQTITPVYEDAKRGEGEGGGRRVT